MGEEYSLITKLIILDSLEEVYEFLDWHLPE